MTRLLLVCLGILACFALVVYGAAVPRWSADEVRESIARDLPLGSSKSEVIAWLQAQPHITHFSDVSEADTLKIVGMGATIANSGPFFFRSSEQIHIRFDIEADMLIRVEVEKHQVSL